MAKTVSHSFAVLTHEILFLPLEHKIHFFLPRVISSLYVSNIAINNNICFNLFTRHYFSFATNPGEQFFTFTSLAAWLLTCCGKNFEQPQEVCHGISDNLQFIFLNRDYLQQFISNIYPIDPDFEV